MHLITPEEIGEITTKHNGGKFLGLTDLATERLKKGYSRDFSKSIEQAPKDESPLGENLGLAKIIPFQTKESEDLELQTPSLDPQKLTQKLKSDEGLRAHRLDIKNPIKKIREDENKTPLEGGLVVEHSEGETLSTFILIEKEKLKKSQQALKQKEIVQLYQKNLNVDVEQVRAELEDEEHASIENGILINRKQY